MSPLGPVICVCSYVFLASTLRVQVSDAEEDSWNKRHLHNRDAKSSLQLKIAEAALRVADAAVTQREEGAFAEAEESDEANEAYIPIPPVPALKSNRLATLEAVLALEDAAVKARFQEVQQHFVQHLQSSAKTSKEVIYIAGEDQLRGSFVEDKSRKYGFAGFVLINADNIREAFYGGDPTPITTYVWLNKMKQEVEKSKDSRVEARMKLIKTEAQNVRNQIAKLAQERGQSIMLDSPNFAWNCKYDYLPKAFFLKGYNVRMYHLLGEGSESSDFNSVLKKAKQMVLGSKAEDATPGATRRPSPKGEKEGCPEVSPGVPGSIEFKCVFLDNMGSSHHEYEISAAAFD
eukprot:gnl/TRDRNA2_/TRDRNA2_176703_c3_seq1.p1 gnl/TRDRNA2_/TRDRNA2_176703_c3~~gnl/TRDRNA2_/TRDRNA2_176703_c3_seq1.p1  ORF type:complete len:347 (-),score=54.15 gnl/TRDRNA2_/TRDRNA2_176703_c3_seq1:105-1145(-)